MKRSPWRHVLHVVAVSCALACVDGADDSSGASGPPTGALSDVALVRQVDHVLLEATQAQELFALASETLELPIAWPFTDYGGFASGGVSLGNVNLEVLSAAPRGEAPSARLRGLALEPQALEPTLATLNERGVRCGRPSPYRAENASGARVTLWTTVALPSVSSDALEVFLCEYADDPAAKRAAWNAQLRERNGGPLGIVALDAVVCGATDLSAARERWEQILGASHTVGAAASRPESSIAPGFEWRLGAGPRLQLVAGAKDELVELALRVESLERARTFLAARELLGEGREGELLLSAPQLRGVRIRLVPREDGAATSNAEGDRRR
ncbi:MAG: hypothetical protein JNN27_00745 [Planctomycetes bacterium]|nr:hypothetical protein [Planctomycetota bacterium]